MKLAECFRPFNAGLQDLSVPLRGGTLPICPVSLDLAKMSISGRLGVESMADSDEADTFAMIYFRIGNCDFLFLVID